MLVFVQRDLGIGFGHTPKQTMASVRKCRGHSSFKEFFMISAKPFKTVDEQINILKSRKMSFPHVKFARKVLSFENYYYVSTGTRIRLSTPLFRMTLTNPE